MNKFHGLSIISLFVSVGYAAVGGMITGAIKGHGGAAFKATKLFDNTQFEH